MDTFVEEFFTKLSEYDLAPESTEDCNEEYKITKLLERCKYPSYFSGEDRFRTSSTL